MVLRKCPRCNGSGKDPGDGLFNSGTSLFGLITLGMFEEDCKLCHGTGYIRDDTIEVRGRHEVHWYEK